MEYLVIFLLVALVMYLSSTSWMKEFRHQYAAVIFFVGYPTFFYFVVWNDFTWIKLALFLVMLGVSIYTHFNRKSQLDQAES